MVTARMMAERGEGGKNADKKVNVRLYSTPHKEMTAKGRFPQLSNAGTPHCWPQAHTCTHMYTHDTNPLKQRHSADTAASGRCAWPFRGQVRSDVPCGIEEGSGGSEAETYPLHGYRYTHKYTKTRTKTHTQTHTQTQTRE